MSNCQDGSDELVKNFTCFVFEFKCLSYTYYLNDFHQCLSYKKIRDGKSYCVFDKNAKELIKNCTHKYLFLCQDQSRCLPNKYKCDGIIQCIDGSDEIEYCKYPKYFRYLQNNQIFIQKWLTFLIIQNPSNFKEIKDYDANIIIEEGKKVVNEVLFGIKCKSRYRNSNNGWNPYCTVPQPNSSSTKFYCENQEDECFNNFKELTCFRCFD